MHTKIERRFREVIKEDKKYIKPWMISWDYQEERIEHVKYPDNYPSTFDTYEGIKDINKWMDWISKSEFKDNIDDDYIEPYINSSYFYDDAIVKIKDFDKYSSTIGRYNAEDYLYTYLYNGNKILDFGPGYGRQINLLSQFKDDLVYVGMDAILQSYCMQNLYYSKSKHRLVEYLDNNKLKIYDPGIYHIPTWRADILPKNYFDKILCVQVLQEINEDLVYYMLDVFRDVIRKDGILYIRDHGKNWKYSAHNLNIEKLLPKYGFELHLKVELKDKEEIHGIPRIWRKI